MKLSSKEWGLIAAGGSIVLLIIYIASDMAGGTPNLREEKYQLFSGVSANALDSNTAACHFFDPGMHYGSDSDLVTLRHGYPVISGCNISAVIHRGFSAMSQPAPQDYAWMIHPPSEETLLWQKYRRKEHLPGEASSPGN